MLKFSEFSNISQDKTEKKINKKYPAGKNQEIKKSKKT